MMAKPLIFNILKTKLRCLLLLAWLLLLTSQSIVSAQSLVYSHSVALDNPGAISLDRLSNIYVTDRKNNLHKFDATGKLTQTFSPSVKGHVASAEAWSMVKILLFYDDRQQITLLDRFLTLISSARLSDFTDGIIRAATLAADDRIWLLNESDYTLNKVDIRYPEAALKTQLNQILNKDQNDSRFMREYQNNLYMVDRLSGIYVFDNMGTYKTRLPLTGLNYVGFKGEELYYLKDGQLVFQHLYTLKQRSLPLPPDKNYQQALIGENFYYFFTSLGFDIYSLQ